MSLHYTDVCALPNGDLAHIYDGDGPVITCDVYQGPSYQATARRWQLAVPEPLLQIRCGTVNGILVAVGKGNASGHALVTVDGSIVADFGPTFGDNSVAIGPEGVYLCRSDRELHILRPDGVFVRKVTAAIGSQGIRDVTPDGEIRLGDDWFRRDVAGLALFQPCQRGAVIVGQYGPPEQIAGASHVNWDISTDNGAPFTAIVGEAYNPHLCQLPGDVYAICARTPSGPALTIVPPYPAFHGVEPEPVIGPISPPRAEDGRLYDLRPFVVGQPATWPRSGPTHPVNQTPPHAGLFEVVKFGTLPPLGAHYEQWGVDDRFFYLLEDASDTTSNVWSDVRHFPRKMAIGLSRAFVAPRHSFTSKRRGTCAVVETRPLGRTAWLRALWDVFDCGPDLGKRAVICMVFDPTEGAHSAERMIELGFFAFDAGWFRWEAHRSDRVYASGTPVFSDASLTARSDFYRLGGPAVLPTLTGCVTPVIPETPVTIPCALKEPCGYLNFVYGGGISLDPKFHPEIKDRHAYEHCRAAIGGDETCSLVQQPNGLYAAKSPNGKAWLSRQPDGSLQERSTSDPSQPQSWESGPYDSAAGTWTPPHGPAYGVVRVGDPGPSPGLLPRLRATQRGFVTESGARVFLGGVSAFMHYERFLRGVDIDPMLRQAQDLGSNCLRVFGMAHYIPVNAGRPAFKPQDFGDAYFDRIPEFCAHVAGFGQYVYWSVFPDGNIILPGIDQQRPFLDRVVDRLKQASNTLGELTNEQDAHSFNTIDPRQVTRPSGIAFTSGSYGDIGGPQPVPWDFVDYHVPRVWPEKAVKDSCVVDHPNYVAGLGVLLGEPDRFGSGGNGNADQARQQAGAARESAIGHIFHSTNGRESVDYDDQTLAIARVWFKAAIGSL